MSFARNAFAGLYWAYAFVVSLLVLHKFVVSRPLVLVDFYLLVHITFFAWRRGPPDAWLLKHTSRDTRGALVVFSICSQLAEDTMNYYLQALKDSFVVKSVSPLAATQCPLEEAHRWKLRILHRSPSLSTSMGRGSPSLSTSMG